MESASYELQLYVVLIYHLTSQADLCQLQDDPA